MLNKEQLENYRVKLELRRKQLIKNLRGTANELEEMNGLELNDEADHASISTETAIDSAILVQQYKELTEIDLSLDKIKAETYGVCEMCEEDIGINRLDVKNFARFCITCREIKEKEQK